MTYLMVGDNGSWTAERQTEMQIIAGLGRNGATVNLSSSRITDDYKLIRIDGRVVGKAFKSKAKQVKFLRDSGLI